MSNNQSQTLNIKNFSISIEGKMVVRNVSFSVASGEIHVVMGANGSGKSSLLNAIAGYPGYEVCHGGVYIGDTELTSMSPDERARAGLFLSMQHIPEIPGVAFSSFLRQAYNIQKGEDVSPIDFLKILEKKTTRLGIDRSLLKRELNVGFSGGEKKQAELVQLAVLVPKFALLDEIDSGVDVDAMKKIFKGVKELSRGGTGFIVVTHYGSVLEYITPDVVHIMDRGRIVKSGDVALMKAATETGFEKFVKGENT